MPVFAAPDTSTGAHDHDRYARDAAPPAKQRREPGHAIRRVAGHTTAIRTVPGARNGTATCLCDRLLPPYWLGSG